MTVSDEELRRVSAVLMRHFDYEEEPDSIHWLMHDARRVAEALRTGGSVIDALVDTGRIADYDERSAIAARAFAKEVAR